MKRLVLALFVSLVLSGCTLSMPFKGFTAAPAEVPFVQINCEPYKYPAPMQLLSLQSKTHFSNKGTHREVTHEGWAVIISWQHEVFRFVKDVVVMMRDVEDCIDAYNLVNVPKVSEQSDGHGAEETY